MEARKENSEHGQGPKDQRPISFVEAGVHNVHIAAPHHLSEPVHLYTCSKVAPESTAW